MFGGTPTNLVLPFAGENVEVVTGVNLPMLIKACQVRTKPLAEVARLVCAQGRDLWTLITNDIDHEKIHAGQVIEGRYEARIAQTPMARLAAEWFAERARLIGSLAGLSDEALHTETSPGGWTWLSPTRWLQAVRQRSLATRTRRTRTLG